MERQDAKRTEPGQPLTDKDELIKLAPKEELKLLSFEADMRAVRGGPEPCPEEPKAAHITQLVIDNTRRNPDGRQRGQDRHPPKNPNGGERDDRTCHRCKKLGHSACDSPQREGGRPPPPPPKGENICTHKTPRHTCNVCIKTGHTSPKCWTAHPELIPEGIAWKKKAAMAAKLNQGQNSDDSPSYRFQCLALTYQRSTATQGVAKHSARAASTITKKTAQQKVQFSKGKDKSTGLHEMYPAEMEKSQKAHLPQPFPHRLPTSSLGPGTIDLDQPPTYVFPESLLEETAIPQYVSTL